MFPNPGEGGKGHLPEHLRAQAEDPRHHPQVPEQEKSQRTKGHLTTRRHSGLQFSTTLRMSFGMYWSSTTNLSFFVNSIVHKILEICNNI